MEFPEPVIEIAVEPKTKGDQEKMGQALARLATEDPSFRVAVDHESGQTIIKGMGELHLEIIVDRMKREFKVEANVGAPQVAYRETITRTAEVDYTHKKQTGGSGPVRRASRSASSRCRRARASSSRTRSSAARCRREYIPGVEKGLRGSLENGVLAGFPVIDFKADAHRRRLSRRRFERARLRDRGARRAIKEGRPEGGGRSSSSRSCGSRW